MTSETLPRTTNRRLSFQNGTAIGISNRWERGQYCSIVTEAGIVGCGIYDLETAAEFSLAVAICKGTPARPLVEPEDLFESKIVGATPQAERFGVRKGMSGREAVELMLAAAPNKGASPKVEADRIEVKTLDHVTLVVKDLERSAAFYAGVLGMKPMARPSFSFAGSWFEAGGRQIHLILEHDRSGPAGIHVPEHLASSRTHHFAFEVPDTYAAAEVLRRRGIPIVDGPKERPDGAVQVFVTDPDGHVVELCTPPKAR